MRYIRARQQILANSRSVHTYILTQDAHVMLLCVRTEYCNYIFMHVTYVVLFVYAEKIAKYTF